MKVPENPGCSSEVWHRFSCNSGVQKRILSSSLSPHVSHLCSLLTLRPVPNSASSRTADENSTAGATAKPNSKAMWWEQKVGGKGRFRGNEQLWSWDTSAAGRGHDR